MADLGGDCFEGLAELVDLDGETGEGERLFALAAVLGHDGVELRAAVEGGPADPGSSGDSIEGDLLASGGEVGAGLLHSGQLVVGHPAWARAMSRSRRSIRRRCRAASSPQPLASASRASTSASSALGADDRQGTCVAAEVRAELANIGIDA